MALMRKARRGAWRRRKRPVGDTLEEEGHQPRPPAAPPTMPTHDEADRASPVRLELAR